MSLRNRLSKDKDTKSVAMITTCSNDSFEKEEAYIEECTFMAQIDKPIVKNRQSCLAMQIALTFPPRIKKEVVKMVEYYETTIQNQTRDFHKLVEENKRLKKENQKLEAQKLYKELQQEYKLPQKQIKEVKYSKQMSQARQLKQIKEAKQTRQNKLCRSPLKSIKSTNHEKKSPLTEFKSKRLAEQTENKSLSKEKRSKEPAFEGDGKLALQKKYKKRFQTNSSKLEY